MPQVSVRRLSASVVIRFLALLALPTFLFVRLATA
jgi:hypothetical protein